MSPSLPISVRPCPPLQHEWNSRLPLVAVATGDSRARAYLIEAFGPCVQDADLWQQAAARWECRSDGYRLEVAHDLNLQPDQPRTGLDAILFDPWDAGHQRRDPETPVVFKRSAPEIPARNEVAYPAWVRQRTLDLDCGPAAVGSRPVVSFCGVAHRPPVRASFIARFWTDARLDCRVIERKTFAYPDPAAFLGSIRQAHYVLCPPGMGRFTYRFYETLAAGRIPVVPDGAHTIPDIVRSLATISFAASADELIDDWQSHRRVIPDIHARNRAVWLRYASPLGSLIWMADEAARRLNGHADRCTGKTERRAEVTP